MENNQKIERKQNKDTEKNILIAFLLNLCFCIFELIGGFLTNSVAITSDAIHDLGDAISIGFSYLMEQKSKKKADEKYTFGYLRFSVLGAFVTNLILIIGSVIVVSNALNRLLNPSVINYTGMIIFAIVGLVVNLSAAYFTKGDDSLNQKAVNLHMLEDVFGWAIVLVGAIIMKFTNIAIIDPILSIGLAVFILYNAICSLIDVIRIFLEKAPQKINMEELKKHILERADVKDIHDLHIWSIDGIETYATVHIVSNNHNKTIRDAIAKEFHRFGINHTTIQIEREGEECMEKDCHTHISNHIHTHHHHNY